MSEMRLYSWFDVKTVLARHRQLHDWPQQEVPLVRVFPDTVELGVVDEAAIQVAEEVLQRLFGRRFDSTRKEIVLESVSDGNSRRLAVLVEVLENEAPKRPTWRPSFERTSLLPDKADLDPVPKPFEPGAPSIWAFYSFKGGVGRTLHLVAAAKALLERKGRPFRLLLVDADLEAPGLSWWAEQLVGRPEISLLDCFALAHEVEDGLTENLPLMVQRIRQQTLTLSTDAGRVDMFFLPAFRDRDQLFHLPLRPEHLVQRPGHQWAVGDLMSQVGKALGVDLVLVDLRAGISELASPLLFDPRVRRILVTTASHQSVEGTRLVLEQLAKLAPVVEANESYFDPVILLSMVPMELPDETVLDIEQSLQTSYLRTEQEAAGDNSVGAGMPRLRVEMSHFAGQLLHINGFGDAMEKLRGTPPQKLMERLTLEWLPRTETRPQPVKTDGHKKARRRLEETARRLKAAETTDVTEFLQTTSLKALGNRFQAHPPVAVVLGGKGSGKTFAFLQIARRKRWSEFLRLLDFTPDSEWGEIWPLLYSQNVEKPGDLLETMAQTTRSLGTESSWRPTQIRALIDQQLQVERATDTEWQEFWLRLISDSMGLGIPEGDPVWHLQRMLEERGRRVVVILDGLEEVFSKYRERETHKTALRSLIQAVPNALRELPGHRLGLLVFLRKDIARAVIPQNFLQFENVYSHFELRWNPEEALRLATWVCKLAGLDDYLNNLDQSDLATAPPTKLQEAMTGIWGLKLGRPESKEAITANWVIYALSDFKGQIQARDIVHYLEVAARLANGQPEYDDRLLQPAAIRNAVWETGQRKVEDMQTEVERLKEIFGEFHKIPDRAIPFTPKEFDLEKEDVEFLLDLGIVLEEDEKYYLPEIYRTGLGFTLRGGARPKVIVLMRKVLGTLWPS